MTDDPIDGFSYAADMEASQRELLDIARELIEQLPESLRESLSKYDLSSGAGAHLQYIEKEASTIELRVALAISEVGEALTSLAELGDPIYVTKKQLYVDHPPGNVQSRHVISADSLIIDIAKSAETSDEEAVLLWEAISEEIKGKLAVAGPEDAA